VAPKRNARQQGTIASLHNMGECAIWRSDKLSGSMTYRYSPKFYSDLGVGAPGDLANAYGSCPVKCQIELIRKRRGDWKFKASAERGNIPNDAIDCVRLPGHNFGQHSHGGARNSSSLLHLGTMRFTYLQTENDTWQKGLMTEPLVRKPTAAAPLFIFMEFLHCGSEHSYAILKGNKTQALNQIFSKCLARLFVGQLRAILDRIFSIRITYGILHCRWSPPGQAAHRNKGSISLAQGPNNYRMTIMSGIS
jgi:hypothetical protein